MSSDIQGFLDEVNKELKFDEYRERFIEELQNHIEDGIHERQLQGIKEYSAYTDALTQLGEVKKLTSFYNLIILSMKLPLSILKKILLILVIITISLPVLIFGIEFGSAYLNTTYAPEYSWMRFNQVSSGMLFKETVRERAGEPLKIERYEEGKIEIWYYTKPKASHNWFIRKIIFYEDTVIGVVKEVYWD